MSAILPSPALVKPDSLRLVLFGLPNAGKSSLLGALEQSASTQAVLLDGILDDVSHGLENQRRKLYDADARATAEEIVPYPVQYRPRQGGEVSAILIDCDGRVANGLLSSDRLPDKQSERGTLVHALSHADALLLVIDVAAPAVQVEAAFTEFIRFLQLLQQGRGEHVEIAGLPIFVVLTKCDLLANPTDTTMDWVERIEQHKAEVDARFRAALARNAPLFGRLDLHLWATAVKRPTLKGTPARPREPYQVAELFRQCLVQAADHHQRATRTHHRLIWTAGGAGTLVAGLLAVLAGLFFVGPGEKPSPLQLEVENLMFADRPIPGERLHGSPAELRDRLERLKEVRNDPGFAALPARFRDFVDNRSAELTDYLAYADKLRHAPRPADAMREQVLRDIKQQLSTELALPHPDWAATDAGRARQEWLDECDALLLAVGRVDDRYRDMGSQARELSAFSGYQGTPEAPGINWRPWLDEVEKLLNSARMPPFIENDPLPGAGSLTYSVALRFDRVVDARAEWEGARQNLQRVRDICAAVGLVTGVAGKPAVLLIPRSGFTLADARTRLSQLQTAYPTYRVDFVRAGLPDVLLPELARTAQTSYEYALEPARAVVLTQLKQASVGTEETVARWNTVRNWLAEPQELASWRVLALTLARLHKSDAADPVTALAGFLQKTSFTITVKRIVLDVPDNLKVKPAFDATLGVLNSPDASAKPVLVFKMDGEGQHVGKERLWRYTFQRQEGGTLTYRPGDDFSATLPLQDDWTFTWTRSRSTLFKFECLDRPPRLHKPNQENVDGSSADRVRLTLTPPTGVPLVPDLMPVVNLK